MLRGDADSIISHEEDRGPIGIPAVLPDFNAGHNCDVGADASTFTNGDPVTVCRVTSHGTIGADGYVITNLSIRRNMNTTRDDNVAADLSVAADDGMGPQTTPLADRRADFDDGVLPHTTESPDGDVGQFRRGVNNCRFRNS